MTESFWTDGKNIKSIIPEKDIMFAWGTFHSA